MNALLSLTDEKAPPHSFRNEYLPTYLCMTKELIKAPKYCIKSCFTSGGGKPDIISHNYLPTKYRWLEQAKCSDF